MEPEHRRPVTRNEAKRRYAEAAEPHVSTYLATVKNVGAEVSRLTDILLVGGDRHAIRVRLDALGSKHWPTANLRGYRRARRAEVRGWFVRSMIFEARDSEIARELGILALKDRSYWVRIRAHQVLAYGLDRSALPALNDALQSESRPEACDSARAAISAIENQNHHKYVDLQPRPGDSYWGVHPWDGGDVAVCRGRLDFEIARIEEAWRRLI